MKQNSVRMREVVQRPRHRVFFLEKLRTLSPIQSFFSKTVDREAENALIGLSEGNARGEYERMCIKCWERLCLEQKHALSKMNFRNATLSASIQLVERKMQACFRTSFRNSKFYAGDRAVARLFLYKRRAKTVQSLGDRESLQKVSITHRYALHPESSMSARQRSFGTAT